MNVGPGGRRLGPRAYGWSVFASDLNELAANSSTKPQQGKCGDNGRRQNFRSFAATAAVRDAIGYKSAMDVPVLTIPDLAAGIRAGRRAVLARAITLIESKRPDHAATARALVQELLPDTGKAVRLGITGVPGVGKSTLIETLGLMLIEAGHRVAVLAVDPSSSRSGGSILGDKTRMEKLSIAEAAFIRPSPAGRTLGGVTTRTREAMLLCEAAGFDVIIVETVGIGQSETAVADMTDFFAVLLLPGGGDELQGIKKGVIELADLVAINKADGDGIAAANRTAGEYRAALHLLTPASATWTPPVVTLSAIGGVGLDRLWAHVLDYSRRLEATGELRRKRQAQQVKWMWAMVNDRLGERLHGDPAIRRQLPAIEAAVSEGTLSASLGAERIAGLIGL